MAEIQGVNTQNASFISSTNAETAVPLSNGHLSNLSVSVESSPLSKLADAAEELTFAKDNSRQTKLSDRKQKVQQDSLAEKIKKLQELMQSTVKDKDKGEKLATKWQQKGNIKDLAQEALDLQGNASEAYALLLSLAEDALGDYKEALVKASEHLMQENSQEILASLNALADASVFLGHELEAAHTYSNLISDFKEPLEMLSYIQEKFPANFDKGLDFLIKALGSDLQAAEPSSEKVALEAVASGLDKVRILNSGRSLLDNLVKRLEDVHYLDVSSLDTTDMLKKLVNLANVKFVTHLDVASIVANVKTTDPEQEVLLAQELFSTIRNCSSQLFGSDTQRLAVLEATQKLVDEKIDREDQWLATL